jgi:hypothetical protein
VFLSNIGIFGTTKRSKSPCSLLWKPQVRHFARLFITVHGTPWPSRWPRGLNRLARYNAGVLGSNPNQGMVVCVCAVLYVGSGLATG